MKIVFLLVLIGATVRAEDKKHSIDVKEVLGPQDFVGLVEKPPKDVVIPAEKRVSRQLLDGSNKFIAGSMSLRKDLSKFRDMAPVYLKTLDLLDKPKIQNMTAHDPAPPPSPGFITSFANYPCLVYMYHCPVRMRFLWVLVHKRSICFIPWTGTQLIQYACCRRCRECRTPFKRGKCLPSCYQRRRLLVLCHKNREWRWMLIFKFIPQCCQCHTF